MKRIVSSAFVMLLLVATLLTSCAGPAINPDNSPTGIIGPGEKDDNKHDTTQVIPGGSDYVEHEYLKQPDGKDLLVTGSNFAETTGASNDNSNYIVKNFFPDLEDIKNKGRGETPIYGIYAFPEDFRTYVQAIADIGFTNIRLSMSRMAPKTLVGGYNSNGVAWNIAYSSEYKLDAATGYYYNDEHMKRLCNLDLEAFITCGLGAQPYIKASAKGKKNADLTIDDFDVDAWIEAQINQVLFFLRRYGPNGSFFEEYPDIRYNPIVYLEPFNEPNFNYIYGTSSDQGKLAVKTELYNLYQIALYKALETEFPSVKVVAFGAGGAQRQDIGFIRGALQQNPEVAETMHVLSTHPYMEETSPFAASKGSGVSLAKQLYDLRQIMEQYGLEDIPIWYSECGWAVRQSFGGEVLKTESGTNQMTQAAMLVQEYLFGLRCGVERITYMYIIDTDGCNYGLVSKTGLGWRLSAYAIKNMIDILPDPLITEAIYEGVDERGKLTGAFVYSVEPSPGMDDVVVAFTSLDKMDITIPWDADVAVVTDMFGTSKLVEAKNGKLTLEIGAYMQYIRHLDDVENLDNSIVPPSVDLDVDNTAALAWAEGRYL